MTRRTEVCRRLHGRAGAPQHHTDTVYSVMFSADGKQVLSSGEDGLVAIRDIVLDQHD